MSNTSRLFLFFFIFSSVPLFGMQEEIPQDDFSDMIEEKVVSSIYVNADEINFLEPMDSLFHSYLGLRSIADLGEDDPARKWYRGIEEFGNVSLEPPRIKGLSDKIVHVSWDNNPAPVIVMVTKFNDQLNTAKLYDSVLLNPIKDFDLPLQLLSPKELKYTYTPVSSRMNGDKVCVVFQGAKKAGLLKKKVKYAIVFVEYSLNPKENDLKKLFFVKNSEFKRFFLYDNDFLIFNDYKGGNYIIGYNINAQKKIPYNNPYDPIRSITKENGARQREYYFLIRTSEGESFSYLVNSNVILSEKNQPQPLPQESFIALSPSKQLRVFDSVGLYRFKILQKHICVDSMAKYSPLTVFLVREIICRITRGQSIELSDEWRRHLPQDLHTLLA